jgi:hypothetical protein
MSLQIRRGTEAQRTGVIFDSGEIIFTTDTQKLYVGDGITTGGKNILATSAGGGVTFNNTTQRFDFTTTGLGLTTSDVIEGTNLYYQRQRAQDDSAALFTATGAPNSTGNITATSAPNTVAISGSTVGMIVGERFVVTGTGGNGLTGSPTTYYIAQIASGSTIKLASSRLNALAGTPLVTVTANASYTGTTYAAGGESSNVVFTYDSVNHTMVANVTLDGIGLTSVQADTAPQLGGNLVLNSRNITGTGNINITGTISATGALTTGSITGAGSLTTRGISNNPALVANVIIQTARAGTATLQNTDLIGTMNFAGYNGTDYRNGTVIASQMASNVTAGNFAVDTGIYSLNADGNFRVVWFRNTGLVDALGFIFAPLTTTAINSFTGSATEGTVIYDVTKHRLVVYTGSVIESVTTSVAVPSTATSTGTPGQIAADASWVYVCTATNTWKRAAIASW